MAGGALVGSVALRPDAPGRHWLQHFYLAAPHQGRGWGSAILRTVLARADALGTEVALHALRGSASLRLYRRHGFAVRAEDPVDILMVRPAARDAP